MSNDNTSAFVARKCPSLVLKRLGVLATLLAVTIILGCMSFSVGNKTQEVSTIDADGALVQGGEVYVHPGEGQEVFYPIPYVQPPNLEIHNMLDDCKIVEQKADRFRICRPGSSHGTAVTWKARGLRVPPVGPPPSPPPPMPTVNLPTEPIPVK